MRTLIIGMILLASIFGASAQSIGIRSSASDDTSLLPRIGETTAEYNARTSGNKEELARIQARRRADQEAEEQQARDEQRQRDLAQTRRKLQNIQSNFDTQMQRIDNDYNQAIGRINREVRRDHQYRCQRYVESGRADELAYRQYC